MKTYLDVVFIVNFVIDFYLLLFVSVIEKRFVSKKRIFIGSLIGSLSICLLLVRYNILLFLFVKFFISALMIYVTFRDTKISSYIINILSFYLVSFLFGGILTSITNSYIYTIGSVRIIDSDHFITYIFLVIILPFALFIYDYYLRHNKLKCNCYRDVSFNISSCFYKGKGFVDTGNSAKYFNKSIIFTDIDNILYDKMIPIKTASGTSLLKACKLDTIYIDGNVYHNVYLAKVNDKLYLDDALFLLPSTFL